MTGTWRVEKGYSFGCHWGQSTVSGNVEPDQGKSLVTACKWAGTSLHTGSHSARTPKNRRQVLGGDRPERAQPGQAGSQRPRFCVTPMETMLETVWMAREDRKSALYGESVSVGVDICGACVMTTAQNAACYDDKDNC